MASYTSTFPSTQFGGYGYNKPYTYGPYEKFAGYPTEFSAAATTPAATGFTGLPSTTYPAEWSRFGGYPTEWSRFGGYPTEWSRFGGFPAEWSRFGGYPTEWSRFGGYPAEWSRFGGYPTEWSRFGGYPAEWSRFGGYPTEWSRFGGFPAEWSRFGGYPAEWSRFGGYPAELARFGGFPAELARFGGFPSELSRFGGFPAGRELTGAFPWSRNWERTFFNDFERSLSSFDRELAFLKNLFAWDNKTGPVSPKDYSSSFVQLPGRPSSSIEYWTFMNPIRFDSEGRRWLRYCFDLPSFKPEEIKVTFFAKATPSPYFEIIAVHDVKTSAKEHEVKRSYERKVYLPADLGLKAEELAKLEFKSHFANDGVLYVEASLPYCPVEAAKRGYTTGYPSFSTKIEVAKKDI